MIEVYDNIIIGGGVAGLSLSALLKKDNISHRVLEAHGLLGGCASYFNRNGYFFDAGATTLSGLSEGRPLNLFLKKINLDLELIKIDPGIISIINGKKIKHYSSLDKKVIDFQNNFPEINLNHIFNLFQSLQQIEKLGYKAIAKNQLPIRKNIDLISLANLGNLEFFSLLPYLNKSFEQYLKDFKIENEEFKKIFDEILFITAQNNSQNTPALFGILGASYPADTHYHIGGMHGFIKKLQQRCGPISFNQQVLKVTKDKGLYLVQTNKESFYTKNIISTLPRNNNLKLLNRSIVKTEETYSAFTLYFTVSKLDNLESLYYQLHTSEIPHAKTHSYFASFSHPEDIQRNRNNQMTVTISTHIYPAVFEGLSLEEYKNKKAEISNFIINHFKKEFNINEILNLEMGTPKTFLKYTNRFNGSVGGNGHHINDNLIKKIFHYELEKNFFEIGDTVFPGQGIAAVIYGSMSLKDFLYP